jgi:hypothetical protein
MDTTRTHGTRLLVASTLAVSMLVAVSTALAAGPTTVGLGTAGNFAVLAGTPSIENTGLTVINGNVGIHPAAAVNGFPPGIINGTIHAADAVANTAKSDLVTAYDDAAGRPVTANHTALGGLTLVGGVYNAGGATLDLTGTLTLDGQNDPSSVWIFQATSDLVTASASSVSLVNGAQACNVFWQVTSSAALGSGSTFVGTIMALASITMADDVTVDGRALARNGNVTLINDTITRTTCAATTAPTATPTTTTTTTTAGSSPVVPFLPNAATLDGVPVTTGSLVAVFGIIAVLSTLMVVAVKRSGARR